MLLISAPHLVMLYICAKFHEIILNGIKVIKAGNHVVCMIGLTDFLCECSHITGKKINHIFLNIQSIFMQ